MLAVAVTLPAVAQGLPEGFTARDIGTPGAVGSTVVENGVWTVKGSGEDLWGKNVDHFQFASMPVTGDGSISARILKAEGGHAEWVKTGVMIRENDGKDSSHASLVMTSGHGARFHWRPGKNKDSVDVSTEQPPYKFPVSIMVQRAGNQYTGYTSLDGKLWTQRGTISFPMADQLSFGLAVMSHIKGTLMTVTFDNVAVLPGITTISGVTSVATDRLVLATWSPVPGAVGYRIYRGADEANMIASNSLPQAEPFLFEAAAGGLSSVIYGASPIFKAADGSLVEGPIVRVR
jgi:hypothetical protein